MTVDVEDYFQVQAFAPFVDRSSWDRWPTRVEANTAWILELFAKADVRATFFTLGWVAERFPRLIRQIVSGGHELASHGYGHELVHTLKPGSFREDLVRAKSLLEEIGGVAVLGYRAPTFSVGPKNPWAYDILAETGHVYSSSVYPVKHDLYGAPDAPRGPYRPGDRQIFELPMTTLKLGAKALPISGGGYFRLTPYWLYRLGLHRYFEVERRPRIFYFHPWEVDPKQPRIERASRLSKFRHYVNIAAVPRRLHHLLQDFAWDRMDKVFAPELSTLSY